MAIFIVPFFAVIFLLLSLTRSTSRILKKESRFILLDILALAMSSFALIYLFVLIKANYLDYHVLYPENSSWKNIAIFSNVYNQPYHALFYLGLSFSFIAELSILRPLSKQESSITRKDEKNNDIFGSILVIVISVLGNNLVGLRLIQESTFFPLFFVLDGFAIAFLVARKHDEEKRWTILSTIALSLLLILAACYFLSFVYVYPTASRAVYFSEGYQTSGALSIVSLVASILLSLVLLGSGIYSLIED